jgi:phosphoglycolate phosphatase-like HAD superfamily hydrolase
VEDSVGRDVLILDFDGVVTKLDVDWARVREEASRLVGFLGGHFGTREFEIVDGLLKGYEMNAALSARPYDDVRAVLESFGGRAYIATMQSSEPVRAFLGRHGLAALVREVVGREMFGRKEDQIKYIIGREAGARRFIFVDDSRAHVENCRRLGLNVTCVLLRRSAGEGLADAIRGLRRFSEQRPIVDWEAPRRRGEEQPSRSRARSRGRHGPASRGWEPVPAGHCPAQPRPHPRNTARRRPSSNHFPHIPFSNQEA